MQSWRDGQGSVDETIAHLQEVMIKAVTLGQRLPGLNNPVILPRHCSRNLEAKRPMLTDNLSPCLNLKSLPDVLNIVTADEYQRSNVGDTNDWYLAFQPPIVGASRIRIVISALRGRPCRNPPPVEIGNLQAEFHLAEGRWEAVGLPILYISDTL